MEERSLAQVIHLKPKRSCFDCRFFEEIEPEDDWGLISYCPIYDETIHSETHAAESCPAFEGHP